MNKQKKQTIVLGALVAVIAAVGAFQFMGSKPKPVDTTEKKAEKPKDEELVAMNGETKTPEQEIIERLMATATSPRDPFAPQAVVIDNVDQQGEQQPTQQPNQYNQNGLKPDPEITGNFGQGSFGSNNGNQGTGTGVGPLQVDPESLPNGVGNTNGLPFALRGVMIGRTKKLCILEFADGRQMLAVEGQSFGRDRETTIISVTNEEVVLTHKGQQINLALNGGN
jgi:hypothetical protein